MHAQIQNAATAWPENPNLAAVQLLSARPWAPHAAAAAGAVLAAAAPMAAASLPAARYVSTWQAYPDTMLPRVCAGPGHIQERGQQQIRACACAQLCQPLLASGQLTHQ